MATSLERFYDLIDENVKNALTLAKSEISVAPIAFGTAFPATPRQGETFFRTDLGRLFIYSGAAWASDAMIIQPITADGVMLTMKNLASENVLTINTATGDMTVSGEITCAGLHIISKILDSNQDYIVDSDGDFLAFIYDIP